VQHPMPVQQLRRDGRCPLWRRNGGGGPGVVLSVDGQVLLVHNRTRPRPYRPKGGHRPRWAGFSSQARPLTTTPRGGRGRRLRGRSAFRCRCCPGRSRPTQRPGILTRPAVSRSGDTGHPGRARSSRQSTAQEAMPSRRPSAVRPAVPTWEGEPRGPLSSRWRRCGAQPPHRLAAVARSRPAMATRQGVAGCHRWNRSGSPSSPWSWPAVWCWACGRFGADAGAAEASSPGRVLVDASQSASRVLDLPVDNPLQLVWVGPADERPGYAKGQARSGRDGAGLGRDADGSRAVRPRP
jgi:hypothetical protein